MTRETNDYISEHVNIAHAIFNHAINEMKEANISYPYDEIIASERESYEIVRRNLTTMQYATSEYEDLFDFRIELISEKIKLCFKYGLLYVAAILFMRLLYEIVDTTSFTKLLNYGVGLGLGSYFQILIHRDFKDLESGDKETRERINHIKTLKEEYDECHNIAVNETNYIYAVNDNLWEEIDKVKEGVKIV